MESYTDTYSYLAKVNAALKNYSREQLSISDNVLNLNSNEATFIKEKAQ